MNTVNSYTQNQNNLLKEVNNKPSTKAIISLNSAKSSDWSLYYGLQDKNAPQSPSELENSDFKNIVGIEEYYINNELFASHFGRGSSLGSAKYFKKIKLPNFIKKAFGKYQISKWIKKSKKILQNDKKNS